MFRRYMATYAREQAVCHLSPALVRNLEEHWNAARAQRLSTRSGIPSRRSTASGCARSSSSAFASTLARASAASGIASLR